MKWLLIASGTSLSSAEPYITWLARNGCESVICFPSNWKVELLEHMEALMLIGGGDVEPSLYGAARHPQTRDPDPPRDEIEIQAVHAVRMAGKPVLGICRGMQVAAVALSGSLIQHIPDLVDETVERHCANDAGYDSVHPLMVHSDGDLGRALHEIPFVNSAHHQSVDSRSPGKGLRVAARSPQGIVEAAEAESGSLMWLVQWHPERLPQGHAAGDLLLQSFVTHARRA